MKTVPKTVGDLKAILEQYPDDMPLLHNRGNRTYEPLSKWTTVEQQTLHRIRGGSSIFIAADRANFTLRTKPVKVVTFG